MAATTLPGIGLKGYAPRGEHEWNVWMDLNLLMLSGLSQLSVRSRTQGLVSGGGAQIAPAGDPNAGKVALFFNSEFAYFTPQEGWVAYVRDEDEVYVFNSGWRPLSTRNAYRIHPVITASTTIPEAALREGRTIVVDSVEPVTLTIVETPADAIVADGSNISRTPTTVIQRGIGQVSVDAGAGIFIVAADDAKRTRGPWSCFSIIPISATEFVLAGDLVP